MMPAETPRSLLIPWLLLSAAALGVLILLGATVWWWAKFGVLGKAIAVGTTIFGFGALAALVLAFYASILLPALRMHEDKV